VPSSSKPTVIDGLSSVRAASRSTKRKQQFQTRPSRSTLPAAEKPPVKRKPGAPAASRIGRTAMPERRELLCYECGYAFTVQGKIHHPICPKCHRTLRVDNVTLNDAWEGTIKTIGNVEIREGCVITSGSITARDVILAGNAEQADLQVNHCLELCAHARFDQSRTTARDVLIRAGARIRMTRKLACRNVEIAGELRAQLAVEGLLRIRPGGVLRGKATSRHLVVDDGGGLIAEVDIQGDGRKEGNA
jgi:cytoskeletal protein CcmA (bactofilin family)